MYDEQIANLILCFLFAGASAAVGLGLYGLWNAGLFLAHRLSLRRLRYAKEYRRAAYRLR